MVFWLITFKRPLGKTILTRPKKCSQFCLQTTDSLVIFSNVTGFFARVGGKTFILFNMTAARGKVEVFLPPGSSIPFKVSLRSSNYVLDVLFMYRRRILCTFYSHTNTYTAAAKLLYIKLPMYLFFFT